METGYRGSVTPAAESGGGGGDDDDA